MNPTVAQLAAAIESLAPLGLAELWDRPGLQVGDPRESVRQVVVALDPSAAAVDAAKRRGAQLLVTHHPLLLQPLERVDISRSRDGTVAALLAAGISLYAAHTNLDRAEGGVNDALARCLDLVDVEPLTSDQRLGKVVVTVPVGHEPRVREAMFAAGAGRIGRYDRCSFMARGEGTFRPGAAADPFIGTVGTLQQVDEVRLEVTVPRRDAEAVVRAVRAVHPYEEAAIDVYPLEYPVAGSGGLGRVGRLLQSQPLEPWARRVCAELGASAGRWVGDGGQEVARVAVCGGSGASLWPAARGRGADVLVTGDVKYHDALDAAAAGLALVDVGHAPSERVAVTVLAEHLRHWAQQVGAQVEVHTVVEGDPFHPVFVQG